MWAYCCLVAVAAPTENRLLQLETCLAEAERYLAETDATPVVTKLFDWSGEKDTDTRRLLAAIFARHLDSDRVVPLKKNAEMVAIRYRIQTGELKPPPCDLSAFRSDHDLFLEAGRAAYAIALLTGAQLPEVHGGLSIDERRRRAARICRVVALYHEVSDYVAGADCATVWAAPVRWRGLPLADRVSLLSLLRPHLLSREPRPLVNAIGLAIPTRVESGDLPRRSGRDVRLFTLHDLFIVGGRASYAAREVLRHASIPNLDNTLSVYEYDRRAKQIGEEMIDAFQEGVRQAYEEAEAKAK